MQAYRAAHAEWAGAARELAETRRTAVVAALASVRDVGGDGLAYVSAQDRRLTERNHLLQGLRIAESGFPSDWLVAARNAGEVRVQDAAGPAAYRPRMGGSVPELHLVRESDTIRVRAGGSSRTERLESEQVGGNSATRGAVHELGHHFEQVVPGLGAASRAFYWDRTSSGETGDRTRNPAVERVSGERVIEVREGFGNAYAGRDYGDAELTEVFTVGAESLLAGSGHTDSDDDWRAFTLGALALLGTGAEGPRVSPLSGVDLSELSETQLRALLAEVWGNQGEIDRVMAELGRREQADDPLADVDLDTLELDDLVALLGEVEDDYAIARISAAMDRWETRQAEIDVDERAGAERGARVDELVAGGMPEMEAWAEVHNLSYQEVERQQRDGFGRQAGETRDQMARRHYDLWVHQQYLDAVAATNGYLVNPEGVAAGVDEEGLFSGRRDRARKYATEELRRWWDANGWMNFTEFKAQMLDREQDRRAAEAGRTARDFNR
jgi:hypothetical protein